MSVYMTTEQFNNLLAKVRAKKNGSFATCKSVFSGEADKVEEFLADINKFKEAEGVAEKDALSGLVWLLKDDASVWWGIMRNDVTTWQDFEDKFRKGFANTTKTNENRLQVKVETDDTTMAKKPLVNAFEIKLKENVDSSKKLVILEENRKRSHDQSSCLETKSPPPVPPYKQRKEQQTPSEDVKPQTALVNKLPPSKSAALLKQKEPYEIYQEIFGVKQQPNESLSSFIEKKRRLFVTLPPPGHTETQQLDMLFGLLLDHIREKVPRNTIKSFDDLVKAAQNSILSGTKPAKKKKRCGFCRMKGHTTDECRKRLRKLAEDEASKPNEESKDLKLGGNEATSI